MSQYIFNTDNGHIQYGFDPHMQGYFIGLYENDECIWNISSYASLQPHPDYPGKFNYSNSELLDIIRGLQYHIPEDFINAIELDLPI